MELIFLGTGAGIPAKARNVSAIALNLLQERGTTWLFDCGEATQHQILHTTIKPRKIEKIFITHLHGDHIFGLPGLLGSRSFQGGNSQLTIYGPKGIKEYIQVSLKISTTHLNYTIEYVEIDEGIIFEDEQFMVEARLLEHGIPSYGYRIVEKDIKGSIQVDKLTQIGITPGPIYKKLKEQETVTLEDGTELISRDYLGPNKRGRSIAILGDTRYSLQSIELAKAVDVLIHESTFGHEDIDIAHDYYHSTTTQAAQIALQANVKHLILTHISSRYQKEDLTGLLAEATEIFPNTDIANDFWHFEINRE